MKKISILGFFVVAAFSCGNPSEPAATTEAKKEPAPDTTAKAAPVVYPYTAKYSSDWKLGDAGNAKLVLHFYKALEEGRFDDLKNYIADTVRILRYDMKAARVSNAEAINKLKDFRARFKTLNEEFIAFVPLHSNDKGSDWVAVWMTEKVVYPNGKKDSTDYQENWLIKGGKVSYVGGMARYDF